MLVQFAMVVFGLFGIAALTIDLGLVRVTQATMQTAADTGAVEGLRFRNYTPGPADDGFASDCIRRAAARTLMARAFADSAQAQFGAGPSFAVVNGQGAADAFGQIVIDDAQRTYKPTLQINQAANAGHGDMVSGAFTYQPTATPDEADDYTRTDFMRNPVPPPPGASGLAACPDEPPDPWTAPLSGSARIDDDAFLVRLRRTTNASGLDDEADVSSGGPTIPLLFGRGGTITAPDTGFSVRRDGLTVRATAIAGARPALTIGLPSGSMYGATRFVLTRAYFETLTNMPAAMPVNPDGTIGPPAAPVGAFLASRLTAVGQPETTPALPDCSTEPSEVPGFVPLVAPIGTTATSRVIGFGRVEPLWNCDSPGTITLSRPVVQLVTSANASAHLPGGLPTDVTPEDAVVLMDANRTFTSAGFGLLVPALVR